jgi:hypothetical protein
LAGLFYTYRRGQRIQKEKDENKKQNRQRNRRLKLVLLQKECSKKKEVTEVKNTITEPVDNGHWSTHAGMAIRNEVRGSSTALFPQNKFTYSARSRKKYDYENVHKRDSCNEPLARGLMVTDHILIVNRPPELEV